MRDRRRARLPGLVVVALVLGACIAPASSSLSAQPSRSTPASAETSPTGTPLPIFDRGQCCIGSELQAGTYRSPYHWSVGISAEVTNGWRVFRTDRSAGGVIALVIGEANEIRHATNYLAFFPISDDQPISQFVADLRATGYLEPSPSVTIAVAGRDATSFDATSEPNPDQPGDEGVVAGAIAFPAIDRIFSPFTWHSESPGATFRFIIVEHASGGGLLIYLEAPGESFDALLERAGPVIASISFLE